MVAKTRFSRDDLVSVLSAYDLGTFRQSQPIAEGTVQTNYLLETTQGRFVFRYYENRSRESVLFEGDLLAFLTERHFPCPAPIRNKRGGCVGMHLGKPYVIFQFVGGQHIEHPSACHQQQLVRWAAELQKLTMGFHSPYTRYRWNYDPDLCRTLARTEAERLGTASAREKATWLADQLTTLDLPPSVPKGICHCDLNFSNVLFRQDEFVALLDFDDANYTYLQFDLVGLIEQSSWPHTREVLDLAQARSTVQEYMRHRPLAPIEQQHLLDVYMLSILFDCVWYFRRGDAHDFYEKRKIEALTKLGRERLCAELFRR